MKWIALFSRTGSEIANLCEAIGRYPDIIYTNQNPENWDKRLYDMPVDDIIYNYHDGIMNELRNHEKALVTLHGYLRIIPSDICAAHNMYNGHPGDIIKYPYLKGKDPQEKAYYSGHTTVGAIIHKVVPEVDAGEIELYSGGLRHDGQDVESFYQVLAEIQLDLWKKFMKGVFMGDKDHIKPSHYKGVNISGVDVTTIDVIEQLYEVSTNDGFTDYNRFQSFKYVWRAGSKDDVLQDLKKARQFLDFAIDALEVKRGLK